MHIHVEYFKELHKHTNDLPSLPQRMKIKKCNKLVCNLYIRTLKQVLNNGLILKKVLKVIQINQKSWL